MTAQQIAAIYGRTSKEKDDAFSVSSQIEAGLVYAQQNGLTVPDGYIFREDFTGKAFDRPEYNKVRALIEQPVALNGGEDVAQLATSVAFTEGLLRTILNLRAPQQLDLVTRLATGDITKNKFKSQIVAISVYRQRSGGKA